MIVNALYKSPPRKKKHARDDQMPFFNKELSKTIMTPTKLPNIFLQNRSEENRTCYTKQIHFCVSLLKKKSIKILWKSKWKVCCRKQAILENSKTFSI